MVMLCNGAIMDLATAQEILKSVALKAAFQAFLLTAREDGYTVEELARQLGVSKRTLYRWIAKQKSSRPRNPRAELVYPPCGDDPGFLQCTHSEAFYLGRKRICLVCMASNFERDLKAQRDPATDPKPDKVPCVPSQHKGGLGKSRVGAA